MAALGIQSMFLRTPYGGASIEWVKGHVLLSTNKEGSLVHENRKSCKLTLSPPNNTHTLVYCAIHVLVQPNFRQHYFYFLYFRIKLKLTSIIGRF